MNQNENTVAMPRCVYLMESSAASSIISPNARYNSTGDDYVTKFQRLVRQWRAETLYYSSMRESIEHQKFREIVAMGEKIVPLLIEEIETQPDPLMAALPLITGEDPVTDRERGNFAAMASVWIEWFKNEWRDNQ